MKKDFINFKIVSVNFCVGELSERLKLAHKWKIFMGGGGDLSCMKYLSRTKND